MNTIKIKYRFYDIYIIINFNLKDKNILRACLSVLDKYSVVDNVYPTNKLRIDLNGRR